VYVGMSICGCEFLCEYVCVCVCVCVFVCVWRKFVGVKPHRQR